MAENVNTGDLFLFSRTALQSNWVRFFTACRLEHVGIAIRCRGNAEDILRDGLSKHLIGPDEPYDPQRSHLYVMDLMIQEQDRDVITGKHTSGFRICEYESRCKNYRRISCRKLRMDVVTYTFKQDLVEFCQQHAGKKFLPGILSIIKFWAGNKPDDSEGLTCTMLAGKFIRDVLHRGSYLHLLPGHFDVEKDTAESKMVGYCYENELIDLRQVHEDVFDSIGWIIVVFVIWLIFFAWSSSRVFR